MAFTIWQAIYHDYGHLFPIEFGTAAKIYHGHRLDLRISYFRGDDPLEWAHVSKQSKRPNARTNILFCFLKAREIQRQAIQVSLPRFLFDLFMWKRIIHVEVYFIELSTIFL